MKMVNRLLYLLVDFFPLIMSYSVEIQTCFSTQLSSHSKIDMNFENYANNMINVAKMNFTNDVGKLLIKNL